MPAVPFVRASEHAHVPLRCVCDRRAWYSTDAVRTPFSTTRTGTCVQLSSGMPQSGELKK